MLGPLARRLSGRYRCIAFDERAHGASDRPPGDDFGWHGFAADVLAVVDHLGLDRPAAFGHSCGAAALLLAEQARPGTFGTLFCYEPVLYPEDTPLVPSFGVNPLAAGALRRRERFASRRDALANFSSKAPFDRLHPDVLAAYVDNGFAPDGGGIRLRCRPHDEAQVYAHGFAHDAFSRLDEVRCPVTLACGAGTDAIGPAFLELVAGRLPASRVEVFADLDHFGPLADPDGLARTLAQALSRGTGTPTA